MKSLTAAFLRDERGLGKFEAAIIGAILIGFGVVGYTFLFGPAKDSQTTSTAKTLFGGMKDIATGEIHNQIGSSGKTTPETDQTTQ